MEKKEIRKNLIAIRDSLSDEERLLKSAVICKSIKALDEYLKAEYILMYASYGSEVCLDSLFGDALKIGKRVCFPLSVFENDVPTLRFYEINSLEELEFGYKGIREPNIKINKLVNLESIKELFKNDEPKILCLVPGVGFDKKGHRMGYGKGFYDRFLNHYSFIKPIGICYEAQIQSEIPVDKYDVIMNKIVTEASVHEIL